jgi:peptide deformylase
MPLDAQQTADILADLQGRLAAGPAGIVRPPHPVLRRPAAPVQIGPSAGIRLIAEMMFDIMTSRKGIGLAAPQVGLPWRLFVMEVGGVRRVAVNPALTYRPGRTTTQTEGCLSLPGLYRPVSRPTNIRIEALDEFGRPWKAAFGGMPARCVQHEFDHLNGVLFTDRCPLDPEIEQRLVAPADPAWGTDAEIQAQIKKQN